MERSFYHNGAERNGSQTAFEWKVTVLVWECNGYGRSMHKIQKGTFNGCLLHVHCTYSMAIVNFILVAMWKKSECSIGPQNQRDDQLTHVLIDTGLVVLDRKLHVWVLAGYMYIHCIFQNGANPDNFKCKTLEVLASTCTCTCKHTQINTCQ